MIIFNKLAHYRGARANPAPPLLSPSRHPSIWGGKQDRWARVGFRATLATVLGLICLLGPGCNRGNTPEADQPLSLLLVVVDTLRADHLGFHGYGEPTTPSLDERSKNWVIFKDAVSPAPFTMPAMGALMTGNYPDRIGVVNHSSKSALSGWSGPTLAELAHAQGMSTAAVVTNPWLMNLQIGFDRGFDTYLRHRDSGTRNSKGDAEGVTDQALTLLSMAKNERFFLWVHYIDPHMPYAPPVDDATALGNPTATSKVIADFSAESRDKQEIYFEAPYTPAEIEDTRRLYDAEIRHVDGAIDRLLQGLEASGQSKNTIVVFASDHGESLGEHGLWFAHDFTLYNELTHVMLAVAGPGIEGRVIDGEVSLVDVLPSLCSWLDLSCPESFDGQVLDLKNTASNRTVFSASAPKRRRYDRWPRIYIDGLEGRWKSARRDGLKVIKIPKSLDRKDIEWEAYDLNADPGELANLWPDPRFKPLAEELLEWEKSMDRIRPGDGAAFEFDEKTRQDLNALGYLDD